MTKPLLISCIVLSLGAAALGFLNRQNLVQTEENLVATTDQKNDLSKKLTGAKKDIQGHKDEITSLSSDKDTLTANLGETQSELEKAKGETASTQKSLEDTKTDLANLQKDADAKDDRIAELETVNSQLQDLNSTLETQVATLRGKEEARQKVQVRQGLQGTILAVNQSWNFVVLSLGDRQGLVPNAELLIQRGGKYLGKVRVTSVESSTAIADILQRTVPRGLTVMPGDNVIYQAQRN